LKPFLKPKNALSVTDCIIITISYAVPITRFSSSSTFIHTGIQSSTTESSPLQKVHMESNNLRFNLFKREIGT
jgi:hypothetical protein